MFFFAGEAHVTYQNKFNHQYIISPEFIHLLPTMEPFYAQLVAAATGSTLTALTSAYLHHY